MERLIPLLQMWSEDYSMYRFRGIDLQKGRKGYTVSITCGEGYASFTKTLDGLWQTKISGITKVFDDIDKTDGVLALFIKHMNYPSILEHDQSLLSTHKFKRFRSNLLRTLMGYFKEEFEGDIAFAPNEMEITCYVGVDRYRLFAVPVKPSSNIFRLYVENNAMQEEKLAHIDDLANEVLGYIKTVKMNVSHTHV